MLLPWWLLLLLSFSGSSLNTVVGSQKQGRIVARNGVVATDHGQCSTIGRDILQKGGHAVDAAVAAALCLGVVSPASSGIGGGAFMLVRSADGKTEAFDMRETAPKLASKNMYSGNTTLKASGARSVAVPGELAGLVDAWKKYGKIPWANLVNPAAQIAQNGFKISPFLYMQMTKTKEAIMVDKGLRDIFTSNGSVLLKKGDTCYNKQLATTLRSISKYGTKAFYNGTIGQRLVEDVKKAGGILTMEDLRNYKVKRRQPIKFDFMGMKLLGMPPPSSGGAAISLILNILTQYRDLSKISYSLMMHREIEALKHAFAVRMNLGDPDFVNNSKDVLKDMLSKSFAAEIRKTILDNTTFNSSHYGGRWNQIHDHGTSHISIVDRQRNAVSMTTTINAYFGSKFLSQSTGIILNNEMDDFSMPANKSKDVPPPAPANFIYPGKRPMSSMTPTIVVEEQLKAVIGASGGSLIIPGVTQVLLNHFVRRLEPLSSVLAPRLYHQLIPNELQYENWTVPTGQHFEVPAITRSDFQKKGHVLNSFAGGTICQFVVVQELFNKPKSGWQLIAVSDPRKGGLPAGF